VSGVLLLILSFWIEVNQIGSMSGFMVALLPLFQAIIFVSLLLASLINSALSSLLAVRPLLWLGMVSYSLYVWHFLFLGHFMRHDSLSEAPLVYHWLLWMPTSIIVAWISYWLLERPFIRLRLKLRD
jgi:peptidoglycan/LPS O-acetylase OafA/YrhL